MAQDPQARASADGVKRLILCFDGTWNTPEDLTNVSRIYAAIADRHSGCPSQLKFYDAGVGTSFSSRVRGGVLGWGLDENILEGYCWLINEYFGYIEPPRMQGDEAFDAGPDILIFGFSRGAYTARSLAGLINRCGVPKVTYFAGDEAQRGRAHPGADIVKQAWQLYRKAYPPGVSSRAQPECADFRAQYCWNVKIKFVGVWDTVGALGVPMFSKAVFARAKYGFHDTSLGRVIEQAYHAVAIDETREDYKVALWDSKAEDQKVEQRWFPGAHANVGGGYQDDLLPDPPLKWIAECATDPSVGLEFTDAFKMKLGQVPACSAALPQDFQLRGDEYLSPVRDSYGEFLHGAYRFFRSLVLKGRYHRRMMVDGIAETIDQTAHMKWSADPRYRPMNLANAGRADFAVPQHGTPVEVPAAPSGPGNP
jgi:hypothetical protein